MYGFRGRSLGRYQMIKNPIARRALNCTVNGKNEEVIIRLGNPTADSDHFICEYEISIGGKSETYRIIGLDSVHALQLAMFMIGSTLQSTPGASNWSWNGAPYTGFPTSLDQPIIGLRP